MTFLVGYCIGTWLWGLCEVLRNAPMHARGNWADRILALGLVVSWPVLGFGALGFLLIERVLMSQGYVDETWDHRSLSGLRHWRERTGRWQR